LTKEGQHEALGDEGLSKAEGMSKERTKPSQIDGASPEMMLALSVPPTAELLSPVRHTVLEWLAGAGCRGERAHDVLVVVSELVSNGVIHDGGDDIDLLLSRDDKGISIEVITGGQRRSREALGSRGVTDPAETGRGLFVVNALTDVLSIEDRRGRHHVICHVAIEDQPGTAQPVLLGDCRL